MVRRSVIPNGQPFKTSFGRAVGLSCDDQGPMGRVDLVYLAYKLIIEYEGDQHRTDRHQWNADIDRHEEFAR